MKMPIIITFKDLMESDLKTLVPGMGWITARPYPLFTLGNRIKATWMVWTGQADALVWPPLIQNEEDPE